VAVTALVGASSVALADGFEWKARKIKAANEVPTPVGNPTATAKATFELEDGAIHYKLKMGKGIQGAFMAHVHAGAPGVAGPIVVWLYGGPPPNPANARDFANGEVVAKGTVSAGDFVGPLAGKSLDEIITALNSGNYYVNIHTLRNRPGEIRGQVVAKHDDDSHDHDSHDHDSHDH
jgi:CHRD domain